MEFFTFLHPRWHFYIELMTVTGRHGQYRTYLGTRWTNYGYGVVKRLRLRLRLVLVLMIITNSRLLGARDIPCCLASQRVIVVGFS